MPTNPKRGWRVGGDAAAEAAPNWRKGTARPTGAAPRKVSRRTLFLLALGGFLGTIGLLIWVATRLMPPAPAQLVVIGAHYANRLGVPHNLLGWHTAKALHEFAAKEHWEFLWLEKGLFGQPTFHELEAKSLTGWAAGLNARPENTLLLYFAVHGGVDEDGPYLLPNDFDPYAGEKPGPGVLRLDAILKTLQDLPAEKNKLLILDVTQVPASWPLGMLHNDFARKLENKLKDVGPKIPNLIVLSASGPDQRAWPSDVWRRTVFGQYVLEGLAGAADPGGRVSAAELIEFVRKQVEAWARANRDEVQTPYVWRHPDTRPENIDLVVGKDELPEGVKPKLAPDIGSKLEAAWAARQALHEQRVPHPALYSPHLWRQYQDSLLRYEEVLLADGPTEVVTDLEGKLSDLRGQIEAAATLELPQRLLGAALPLPAVFGRHAPYREEQLRAPLVRLQSAKDDKERKAAWEALVGKAAADERAVELLRWRTCGLLLQGLARGKDTDPERATVRDLMNFLLPARRDGLRPAEVHLLLMLHQELTADRLPDQTPDGKRVSQAVRVRLLAEETALVAGGEGVHPFAERVYPWVQTQVEAADEHRRLGEDLLLSDHKSDWAEAESHLVQAEKSYLSARDIAAQVRQALDVSARALSDLPYYSRWVARRRLAPPAQAKLDDRARIEELEQTDRLVKALITLWEQTHELVRRLRQPDPKAAGLAELADTVAKSLRTMASEFDQRAADAAANPANQPHLWHVTDEFLATPLPRASLRGKLLARRREISDFYDDRHRKDAATGAWPDVPLKTARADLQRRDAELTARRQGRLATAALGQEWVDRQAQTRHKTDPYTNLMNRMELRPEGVAWEDALTIAGDQVGLLWRLLPAEIERQAGQIDSKKMAPTQVGQELASAAALCRLLDGPAAEHIPERLKNYRGDLVPADPIQGHRRWELSRLLVWQARRAWEDHWTHEESDPQAREYYLTAKDAYLAGAEEMALATMRSKESQELRLALVDAARKKLAPTRLSLAARNTSLSLTTERQFTVAWLIQREGVPAAAVPMFRVLTRGPVNSAKGENLKSRRALKGWPARELPYDLQSPDLVMEEEKPRLIPLRPGAKTYFSPPASATGELRFRGRKITANTDLRLYLGADTTAIHLPPPPEAALAVRAEEDIPRGAVALVVDYSGSMDGEKIRQARSALRQILEKLGDGTRLTVLVFGQRGGESDADIRANGNAAYTKVETILPVGPWKKEAQLDGLMRALEAKKPWHLTHLVGAMRQARDTLLADRQCQGLFKTILILTDGEDTMHPPRWSKEITPPEIKQRAAAIRKAVAETFSRDAVGDERFAVNMVLFGTDKGERERARDQFQRAIESLPEPGLWSEKADPNEMMKALYEGLRPRMRLYENEKPVAGMPLGGYRAYLPSDASWIWSKGFLPLPGKIYHAEIFQHRQRVGFDRGDYLAINVKGRPNGDVQFERQLSTDIYKTYHPVWKNALSDGKESPWRLAVHRNQHQQAGSEISTGNALDLLTTIENSDNVVPEGGILQQLKPGLTWFDLYAGPNQPAGLSWRNQYQVPAPAWNLHVPRWDTEPGPGNGLVPPLLKAWWSDGEPRVGYVQFPHNPTRDLSKEVQELKHPDVAIESITQEMRRVQGAPGGAEQTCLVVRLRHEPGKPYYARLVDRDRNIEGEEHYFYRDPGKVTAVFWPVRRVQEAAFTLHLVSVNAFKANAFAVELQLPAPRPTDAGPPPVSLPR